MPSKNVTAFAVGTGRCGTKFLSEVMSREPSIASIHERDPLLQTFHRYCTWYDLPVDDAGFLAEMQRHVAGDHQDHTVSFESSAFLSLSIAPLHRHLGAKFVLLVRQPENVVNSYINKGWYDQPVTQSDPQLALGYQPCKLFHHFLGRTVPRGEELERWQAMSRVGKLAWYWTTMNRRILDQFENLPPTDWRVVKLESLDYDEYLRLAAFVGFQPSVTRDEYMEIAARRPNSVRRGNTIAEWTDDEIADFEQEVEELATELGYEYRVDRLEAFKFSVAECANRTSVSKSEGILASRLLRGLGRRFRNWTARRS